MAETEEENPGRPRHGGRGFRLDQSTVTVIAGEPPHDITDHPSRSAEEVLTIIAGAMAVTGANNAYTGGETPLALGPEHAPPLARGGLTKREGAQGVCRRAPNPPGR